MATNLRLSPESARALQDAARASGRSQQELIREALDQYLGLRSESAELQRLQGRMSVASQIVTVLLVLATGAMAIARYVP